MSDTGPNQGTLKVFPSLLLGSAYILLRPFFRPLKRSSNTEPNTPSLKFEDWSINLDSPEFPGSVLGNTQELNERTHPHLDLAKTVVSVPRVDPGDQVFCTYHCASSSSLVGEGPLLIGIDTCAGHCDVIHAVENQHRGTSDSSVMYIPAVPLTVDKLRVHVARAEKSLLTVDTYLSITVPITYAFNARTL